MTMTFGVLYKLLRYIEAVGMADLDGGAAFRKGLHDIIRRDMHDPVFLNERLPMIMGSESTMDSEDIVRPLVEAKPWLKGLDK